MIKDALQPTEGLPIYSREAIVLPSPEEVDKFAAQRVIEQISAKPNSVLTLPTGATPQGMYRLLVEANRQGLDFSQITIFNLDEYWPIRQDHPSSYTQYMRDNFINHVNMSAGKWHIPNGEATSAEEEAANYERLLQEAGAVDLAVIGIGPGTTYHIGFNEQGSPIDSRTRYMPLDEQTRETNARFFADPSEIPDGTITQGVANILEANTIMLLAKGSAKAEGIRRTLSGPIGTEAPSTFLQQHPDVTIVVDQQAGQLLP